MRVAKSKGKPAEDKGKEKIVRRYVVMRYDINSRGEFKLQTESLIKFILMVPSSTKSSSRMNKLVIAFPFVRILIPRKTVA